MVALWASESELNRKQNYGEDTHISRIDSSKMGNTKNKIPTSVVHTTATVWTLMLIQMTLAQDMN